MSCGTTAGRGRRATIGIAFLAVTLSLTSCSNTTSKPSVPPVAFGAPTDIAPAPAVPQGQTPYQRQLPVALDGATAYIGASDSVAVIDTQSGQTTATIRPQNPSYVAGPVGGPPLLSTVNNNQVALWPFFVQATAPSDQPPPEPPTSTSVAPTSGSSAAPSSTQAAAPSAAPDSAVPLVGDTPPSSTDSASASPTPSATPSAGQPSAAPSNSPPLPTGNAIELASIGTQNHVANDVLIGMPDWAKGSTSQVSATVLGASGATVLLYLTDGVSTATIAADATTGRTVWTRDGFAGGAMVGDTVVGVESDGAGDAAEHVSGLSAADGRTHWSALRGYGLHVSPAGPTLVAAIGQSAGRVSQPSFQLLDAANGAPVAKLTVPPLPSSRCIYDGLTTTVCFAPDSHRERRAAAAVNSQTGKLLWSLPDYSHSNATAPLVASVWHGKLYATDDGSSTEVYQADTQAIVHTSPGPPPMVVGDRIGIGLDANNTHIVTRQSVATGH